MGERKEGEVEGWLLRWMGGREGGGEGKINGEKEAGMDEHRE